MSSLTTSGRVLDQLLTHLVKDGGTVVSDDDFAIGCGNHLVHATWAETGPDSISDGLRRLNVGLPDVILPLVVDEGLRSTSGTLRNLRGKVGSKKVTEQRPRCS